MTATRFNCSHLASGNYESAASLEFLVEEEREEAREEVQYGTWQAWMRYGKGLFAAALVLSAFTAGAALVNDTNIFLARSLGADRAASLVTSPEDFNAALCQATAGKSWREVNQIYNEITQGTPPATDPEVSQLQLYFSAQPLVVKQALTSQMISSTQFHANATTTLPPALATATAALPVQPALQISQVTPKPPAPKPLPAYRYEFSGGWDNPHELSRSTPDGQACMTICETVPGCVAISRNSTGAPPGLCNGYGTSPEWTNRGFTATTWSVWTDPTVRSYRKESAHRQVPPLANAQEMAILDKHNTLRAQRSASNMLKMDWDQSIAATAQSYAYSRQGSCSLEHSIAGTQFRGARVGENMAMTVHTGFLLNSGTSFDADVQDWYNEVAVSGPYRSGGTFTNFTPCTGVCGHYTQVVWQAANRLGCGVAACSQDGMPGYLFVCQYGTSVPGADGGNAVGEVLYTEGSACSACPSGYGTCDGNLCTTD